jgi:hypothetical protein
MDVRDSGILALHAYRQVPRCAAGAADTARASGRAR